ncbi:choice-of-anchor D domain-containing protein, partial [candidate division KSB1 bacterium]|nr:choice-of-anchor D domain-containing protein [candidate division KSB1 bacterium]
MKINRYILLLSVMLLPCLTLAQYDNWRNFRSGNQVNALLLRDDVFYAGTNGGLVEISRETGDQIYFNKTNSGLPGTRVNAISQDQANHLWIGTDVGLARFDGSAWTIYNTSNSDIPSDNVTCITQTPGGGKWIGTYGGGLAFFDGATWLVFDATNSGLPVNNILSVTLDPDQNLWIGTENGGLVYYDQLQWTVYNMNNSEIPSNTVYSVAMQSSGTKWIGTAYGGLVALMGDGRWFIFNTSNSGLAHNNVYSVAVDIDELIWCATEAGLSYYTGKSWETYDTITSGLADNFSRCVLIDGANHVWVGTNQGAAHYTRDMWTQYTTSETGLPSNQIKTIAIDASGTKWIGTSFNGLVSYNGTTWTGYNAANSDLPSDHLTHISVDIANNKWIATDYDGLARLSMGDVGLTWQIFNMRNSSLPDNSIYTVTSDSRGIKWIGTSYGGLAEYDDSEWHVYNFSNSGLPDNGVRCIGIDIDNNKWIGTSFGGLAVFNGESWQTYTTINSDLPDQTIQSLALDTDGSIWIGTALGGLAHFDKKTWNIYNVKNSQVPNNNITSIAVDGNGIKWIGTPTGLAGFDGTNWTVYTSSNSGLIDDRVNTIIVDSDNVKWIGTENGLSSYGNHQTATSPKVTLSMTTVDFDVVALGDSSTRHITLTNSGRADLQIFDINLQGWDKADFRITSSTGFAVLPPTEIMDIDMTFRPTVGGSRQAVLRIDTDAASSPDSVSLTGFCLAPSIRISSEAINYGSVRVGQTLRQSFSIMNTGLVNLNVNKVSIDGLNRINFVVDTTGFVLTEGQSRNVEVAFTPDRVGNFSANLNISSNAGENNIALSGTGIDPVITLSASSLTFGTVNVGNSAVDSLLVTNSGTAVLNVTLVNLAGVDAAAFNVDVTSFNLNPRQSQKLKVTFSPDRVGEFNAFLNISTNVGLSPVTLTGNGIAPQIAVSPSVINFGGVDKGVRASSSFAIENSGTAVLEVTDITISGTHAVFFSVDSTSFFISPGESKRVVVFFTPDDAGPFNAVFNVSSTGGTVFINATGIGLAPQLTAMPDTLTFGTIEVGNTSYKNLIIKNTGTTLLNVNASALTGEHADRFFVASLGFSLAPDDSEVVSMSFTPDVVGSFTASLELATNAGTRSIPITGYGVAAGLSLNPMAVNFRNVGIGLTSQDTITITNTGTAVLRITPNNITGTDAIYFTVTGTTLVVEPGASQVIIVYFSPLRSGTHSATLNLVSNATNAVINLVGNGVAPLVAFTDIECSFGVVPLGEDSSRTVYLYNNSIALLQLQTAVILGPHAGDYLLETVVDTTLQPMASLDLQCRFTPTGAGTRTAWLVITSNGQNSPDSLALQGRGMDLVVQVDYAKPVLDADFSMDIAYPADYEPVFGKLFYRRGGETTFQSTDLVYEADNVVGAIPKVFVTLRGIEYYVYLTDGLRPVYFPNENAVENPAVVQVSVEKAVPPNTVRFVEAGYKMISVPLKIQDPFIPAVFEDDYGEYDRQIWRLLRYSSGNGGFFIEYPNIQAHVDPGIAFWLITRDGKRFDVSNARSTDTSKPFTLTLQPGWNQIGNPFAFPVAWRDIEKPEVISSLTWFDGSEYIPGREELVPWEGYFVYNSDEFEPVDILIPPIEHTDIIKKVRPITHAYPGDYKLQLSAKIPETPFVDTYNYLGILENASPDLDTLDFFEAPPIGEYLQLYIFENNQKYAGNFKPKTETGQTWQIKIGS